MPNHCHRTSTQPHQHPELYLQGQYGTLSLRHFSQPRKCLYRAMMYEWLKDILLPWESPNTTTRSPTFDLVSIPDDVYK